MQHIVIIGNGIAGITTARHIRQQSDARITVVSGESDHFFSRTALMYIYMGHMKYEHIKPYEDAFWDKNRIALKRGWVSTVDFDKREIVFQNSERLPYDRLVLATGSKSNKFGWSGQDLEGVQGLYSLQDLERMEANTKAVTHAVVVGGGLIGVEMAEMLHSRGIHVTFLVREKNFWDTVLPKEEASLIDRHLLEHGIDLRLGDELEEIVDDGTGKVKAVRTKSGEQIECQFVGLTVGVSPNIDFLKGTPLECDRGILVNEYLETNLPHVYAAGDCVQMRHPKQGRKPIEAVWYTGRMMGEALAQTLTGEKTAYDPGIWFNSAKFFDIEYQTYGNVTPVRAPEESDFYWEHRHGKICMRLVYRSSDGAILGVNVFGIRLRHAVVERWIRDERPVTYVLEHLADANFDPEFYRGYEPDILAEYNKQNGTQLKVKKRSWRNILAQA